MPEIIRKGDPTSHGGVVLEGSMLDICMGQPIAYIGHKVKCPKCKGTFPIVEGVMTTSFYGKGVAVAGMKTSCGAVLIATQFTDTVEWSSGGSGSSGSASAQAMAANVLAAKVAKARNLGEDSPDEQVRAVDAKTNKPIPGLAYCIQAPDGAVYSGHTDENGLCERIKTFQPEELTVWFGEEAEAKMQAG